MNAAEPQRPRRGRVIAEHLEHIANLIRKAELGELATPVSVSVLIIPTGDDDRQREVVDVVDAITDQKPQYKGGGTYAQYQTELDHGQAWSLSCSAFVKRPMSEADQLRARVAELEAQLGEGGSR